MFSWGQVSNNLETTLAQACTPTSPANGELLAVTSTAGFTNASYIVLDWDNSNYEIIRVAPQDSSHFTVLERGADNTVAHLHANGATAQLTINAAVINELRDKFVTGHNHASGDGGLLDQDETHSNPDTDVSASSLHHTLGAGQFQAAAGNHTHSGSENSVGGLIAAHQFLT